MNDVCARCGRENPTPILFVKGSGKVADLISDLVLFKFSSNHCKYLDPKKYNPQQRTLKELLDELEFDPELVKDEKVLREGNCYERCVQKLEEYIEELEKGKLSKKPSSSTRAGPGIDCDGIQRSSHPDARRADHASETITPRLEHSLAGPKRLPSADHASNPAASAGSNARRGGATMHECSASERVVPSGNAEVRSGIQALQWAGAQFVLRERFEILQRRQKESEGEAVYCGGVRACLLISSFCDGVRCSGHAGRSYSIESEHFLIWQGICSVSCLFCPSDRGE